MEQINTTTQFDGATVISGAYKTDISKGTTRSDVSSQWFSRPDDQRFLNLNDLRDSVQARREASTVVNIDPRGIQVQCPEPATLNLILPEQVMPPVTPNHWSFGQLASLVKAPSGYLRKLPTEIAAINLQAGLQMYREGPVQAYTLPEGDGTELRAATGPTYGRVWDEEVVRAVQRIAGDGTGDSHWKVPGVLNWTDGTYNPDAPITRESTTLFASDRDVFLFLVDDRRPIQIGTLPSGDPDLVFRGFFVRNSETGAGSFQLAAFYLRGVCQNRMMWGVERFQELRFRHSSGAPERFMAEAAPALESFAEANTSAFLNGVQAAREAIVAKDDDDRIEFLRKRKFSDSQARQIISKVIQEEGRKPSSVWDFVQGITAHARVQGQQDARTALERQAGKLLDKVA